jgi:hypothetical protein
MEKKEYLKKYRELHKEEIKEKQKEWYEKNKEEIKERQKKYYEENKEEIKKRNRINYTERTESDMNYKIKMNVLKNIEKGIKNGYFEPALERLLGYSYEDFKREVSVKFKLGMRWENYGRRFINDNNWYIHHIIPMKIYNFYNEEDIKKCWDLRNLTPLWNFEKNAELNFDIINRENITDLLPETILLEDIKNGI